MVKFGGNSKSTETAARGKRTPKHKKNSRRDTAAPEKYQGSSFFLSSFSLFPDQPPHYRLQVDYEIYKHIIQKEPAPLCTNATIFAKPDLSSHGGIGI